MNVREKLVELIEQSGACFECFPVGDYEREQIEKIVDHLITHGVTVQESGCWIKTETNSTCSKCGGNVISWSGEYDGYERERGICLMHYCPHCGAKLDLPQPPKGE